VTGAAVKAELKTVLHDLARQLADMAGDLASAILEDAGEMSPAELQQVGHHLNQIHYCLVQAAFLARGGFADEEQEA
jgi:hypothetical protein